MNRSKDPTAKDSSSLRDRQSEATRHAIVSAFLALARQTNAVSISMPAVAAEAGVSVRTLYRYFDTKDALQNAAALTYSDRAMAAGSMDRVDAASLGLYLRALWTDFGADVAAVAAQHATPVGRQLRASRLAASRTSLAGVMPELDAERIDLIIAVFSSSMFLELADRMGHEPARAAALAYRLVELIAADAGSTIADLPTGAPDQTKPTNPTDPTDSEERSR